MQYTVEFLKAVNENFLIGEEVMGAGTIIGKQIFGSNQIEVTIYGGDVIDYTYDAVQEMFLQN